MSHDPLCGEECTCSSACEDVYCNCDTIARVRADERAKTLDAAREAVFSCHLRLDSGKILRQGGDWENAIDKACRAIDALRTKP